MFMASFQFRVPKHNYTTFTTLKTKTNTTNKLLYSLNFPFSPLASEYKCRVIFDHVKVNVHNLIKVCMLSIVIALCSSSVRYLVVKMINPKMNQSFVKTSTQRDRNYIHLFEPSRIWSSKIIKPRLCARWLLCVQRTLN